MERTNRLPPPLMWLAMSTTPVLHLPCEAVLACVPLQRSGNRILWVGVVTNALQLGETLDEDTHTHRGRGCCGSWAACRREQELLAKPRFICLEFLHCVISWAQGPDVAAVVAGRPADGAGAGGQAGLLARFSPSSVSYQRGGSLVQGPTAAAVVAGWAADGAGAAGRSGATRAAD